MNARVIDFAASAFAPVAEALSREQCLLPYYHMVSDEHVPHVSPLYRFRSVAEFTRDLEFFLRNRRPLSLTDFLAAVETDGNPPKQSFLLTFDDGFREMFDVVRPLLQKKGVPAVFFLMSSSVDNQALCLHQKIALLLDERQKSRSRFPDAEILNRLRGIGIEEDNPTAALRLIRWADQRIVDELGRICGLDFESYARMQRPFLTSTQIKDLLRHGFQIGAHSIDHPVYADLSLAEQVRQTSQSMEFLVRSFGIKERAFAFPHTDRGVSREFFHECVRNNLFSISFGTSAPAIDCVPRSFQRMSMEKTIVPARAIVSRNSLRKLRLRASGNSIVQRA